MSKNRLVRLLCFDYAKLLPDGEIFIKSLLFFLKSSASMLG